MTTTIIPDVPAWHKYPADDPPHLLVCPACSAPALDVSAEFTYVRSQCTACPWRNHLADAPRLLAYWLPVLSAAIERLHTEYGLTLAPILVAQLVADTHPLSALTTIEDYLQQAAANTEYATPAPTQRAWTQRRQGAAFREAGWFRRTLWATVTAIYADRGEAI